MIKETLELLQFYVDQSYLINPEVLLTDVTLDLQNSKPHQICFYNLNTKSRELLDERLKTANAGLLILNGRINEEHLNKIIVDSDHFLDAQRLICNKLYKIAANQKLVGVTGTNGKTTVVELCRQMAAQLGHSSISIGTLGVLENKTLLYDHKTTTPSYVDLKKILHQTQDKEMVFLELSSHALDQDRIHGMKLAMAAFTSFSQDHLDYHKTFEHYLNSKRKIIEYLGTGATLIVPSDCDFEAKIKDIPFKKATSLTQVQLSNLAPEFQHGHNKENLQVALDILRGLELDIDKIDFSLIKPPKGRFETFQYNNSLVIVDYAHTPDALIKICQSIRLVYPKYKLITLFGCGGNRDKSKRPLMGQAVSDSCDEAIITTDNPRFENPNRIIDDIRPGMRISYKVCVDRESAIREAIKNLMANEILLVAGKGHENYQEIKGVRYPFSDQLIVEEEISLAKEKSSC